MNMQRFDVGPVIRKKTEVNNERAAVTFASIEEDLLKNAAARQSAAGDKAESADALRDMLVDPAENNAPGESFQSTAYEKYDGIIREPVQDVPVNAEVMPRDTEAMPNDAEGMPFYEDVELLEDRYEEAHRTSVELTGDVFAAIGKAKARAKREQEEAAERVVRATAIVDDATGKLKIIEMRYESARDLEHESEQILGELPYVGEASIEDLAKQIDLDKAEVQALMRKLVPAEKTEKVAREEALTALHATDAPEAYMLEKKKVLAFVEKRRNLTDYLLTVAKKNRSSMDREDEYSAARREAAARNADYFNAYREYTQAESALEDARLYAHEKKSIYESAHRETLSIRKKIDSFKELIDAEEKQLENMKKACEVYEEAYEKYLKRQKKRQARGRQLEAAREEYARLLDVLAAAKTDAEVKTERMYRTEKLSVREVIETNVLDEDLAYLNRYGEKLQRAQADEQNALGILRRARKKSQT